MTDTTALKNRIRAAIKANDNQEITGPVLQQALLDIVDELAVPEIDDNAVTESKIADNAVTESKIADNAVTSGKANFTVLPNVIIASNVMPNVNTQYGYISFGTREEVLYITTVRGKIVITGDSYKTDGEYRAYFKDGTANTRSSVIFIYIDTIDKKFVPRGQDRVFNDTQSRYILLGSVVCAYTSDGSYKPNSFARASFPFEYTVDGLSKITDGGVFDISAYHATGGTLATYDDIKDALGTNGANVPQSLRKGGMSVKFVQSSDNKYVQWRCMAQNFTTDVTQWQGVDDVPTAASNNLVKSNGVAEQTYIKTLLQRTQIGHVVIDTSGKIVSRKDYRLNYVACEAGKTYLITIAGKNSTPAGAAFYSTLPSVGSVGEPILMSYTGSDHQEKQISYTANSDGYIAASSYGTNTRTVELLTPLKDVALQNKESISNINGTLQFDNTPTPNSTKLVNSGSIFEQTRKIYADNTLLQTTQLAHCWLDNTGTIVARQDWRIFYTACEADKYYSIYIEGYINAPAMVCFFDTTPSVGGTGTILMTVSGASYNTKNYLFKAPSNGYIVMSTYAMHTKKAYTTVVLQDIQTLLQSSGYINTNALSEKCVTKDKISQELQENLLLAIRSYYVTPYNEFKRKIDALQGNIVSNILFMTDLHYNALPEHYYALFDGIDNITNVLALCSKEMDINLFCLGGDYPQLPNTATKQDGIDNIYWLNKRLSEYDCPYVMMAGNHEYNYTGTGEGAGLTWNEIYNFVNKKSIVNNKMVVSDTDSQVQCLDDSSVNIRYIFINPGDVSDEKHKTAVLSMCQSKPQGYDVIIFCHFVGTNTTLYNSVKSMIDYLDTNNQRIIAWVGGHNHSDSQWVYNNTLCISCLQSGFYTSAQSMDGITYEHTAGTITESAATMLVIDKTLGKIYAIRLGLGVDREFNYNTTSGSIGLVTD